VIEVKLTCATKLVKFKQQRYNMVTVTQSG